MSVINDSSDLRAVELACKLSLLDTLHVLNRAWNKVSQTTIASYYRRASFIKDNESDNEAKDDELDDTLECIPEEITTADFDEYMAIDAELQIEEATDGQSTAGAAPGQH